MRHKMNEQELSTVYDKLVQELRRGVLVLAALSRLKEARYGYALIDELAELGLQIDQGTLYPLLRRLEGDGLLESQWNTDGSRPRRYYRISPAGLKLLHELAAEWRGLNEVLDRLLAEETTAGR
jgi:DNA-binding PadR family transcriptional regulator